MISASPTIADAGFEPTASSSTGRGAGVQPCLLGRIALAGRPLGGRRLTSPVDAALLYRDAAGRVEVMCVGSPRELFVHRDEERFGAVLGRIFGRAPLRADTPEASTWLHEAAVTTPQAAEGIFALLHVDESPELEVTIRTDKFGFQPLFYTIRRDVFYFSTHLHGLRQMVAEASVSYDASVLLHYYHFGVSMADRTLLKGIRKVAAGTALKVRRDVRTVRYFDPIDLVRTDLPDDDAAVSHILDEAMTSAVRRRVRPGERVGLALSGGVDSGYIAIKLKEAEVDFASYNLSYGDYYDEHDRIGRLEETLGIDVRRIRVSATDLLASFERANARASEPAGFNDAALLLLAEAASADGISTIWDGDGADRLFLGMNGHRRYMRTLRAHEMLRRFGLLPLTLTLLKRAQHPAANKLHVVMQGWRDGIRPYVERRHGEHQEYDVAYERDLYRLGVEPIWRRFEAGAPSADPVRFFVYQSIAMCPEMFFHTPVEQQANLGSTPISPYWDDELVALGLSIPTGLKLKNGTTKYVLRRAAAVNGNASYWMLPKIGLQNAFSFVKTTADGQAWIDDLRRQTASSETYGLLQVLLREPAPDVDRLIPLMLWQKTQQPPC